MQLNGANTAHCIDAEASLLRVEKKEPPDEVVQERRGQSGSPDVCAAASQARLWSMSKGRDTAGIETDRSICEASNETSSLSSKQSRKKTRKPPKHGPLQGLAKQPKEKGSSRKRRQSKHSGDSKSKKATNLIAQGSRSTEKQKGKKSNPKGQENAKKHDPVAKGRAKNDLV